MTTPIADKGIQKGKPMWPSLPVAEWLFSASNSVLIFGLAVTVVATIGAVWMANVRDGYLKRDLADANTRIADASTRGDEARKDAAKANERAATLEKEAASLSVDVATANERAAKADEKAAEAQLALERFKAPRSLSLDAQQRIVEKLKTYAGQQVSFSVVGENEPIAFQRLLKAVLLNAGWVPIAPQVGDLQVDDAGVMFGVAVEVQVRQEDAAAGTPVAGVTIAVTEALAAEGIAATSTINPKLKVANAINIAVGTKP
jgi:hypothetical protein